MIAGILLGLLVAAGPQLPLSVATSDDALAAIGNPAGLGAGRKSDFYWMYNFRTAPFWSNSAFCGNAGPLGAFWEPGYRWGVAAGSGKDGIYGGVRLVRDTETHWSLAAMLRPRQWLSLGAVWNDVNHDWGTVTAGAALRPLGNRLTLSADVLASRPTSPVLGIEAEPVNGLGLAARLKPEDRSFSAGLTIGLGRASLGAVGSKVGTGKQAGALLRLGSERRRSLVRPSPRFLELRLAGSVADQMPGFSLGSRPSRTTWDLLELLRRAKDDPGIGGIVLRLDGLSASPAQAQELRQALGDIRARGKKVFVYAPSLGMNEFYVASVADRIICYPLGDVNIPGVRSSSLFLKGTLEKLGIEPDAIRHGKYKSAIEAFTEDSLTDPSREQLEAMLDAAYREFLSAAGSGRGIGPDSIERLVGIGFFTTGEAMSCGLVDTLCYPDELDDVLRKQAPGFRKVSEQQYRGDKEFEYDWQEPDQVAVVYATGTIAPGESRTSFLSGEMTMGAATIARALKQARNNPRVKAIVLRVDTPGGDGFASDMIWREVELCRKKKPVAVSMGSVAASGGYYIACTADRIFASPGTVTGSIGVFGLKFVTEGLYNKLGARRQVLKRGERADAASDLRPFSTAEESLFQRQIDEFYRQFVEKVASGRQLSFESVDSVGQGRVWMGSDAVRVGLIDSLGGLIPAIDWARREARLAEYDLVFYPKPRGGLGAALGRFLAARLPEVRLWP